jgi:hypothetical protein
VTPDSIEGLAWCLPGRYGERFALTEFADGSVLLDLQSGAFYQLNRVAAEVCRRLAQEEAPAAIARALAGGYGISQEQASRDVADLLARLSQPPALAGVNPLRFETGPDGFPMRWQGHDVCRIDPRGESVTRLAGADELRVDPAQQLLWAAPHLLLLRGLFVLHAAAVRVGGGVLAFGGSSGVGKTTLARCFAEQGPAPVAEDLVLVAFDRGAPEAVIGGEAVVRRWAADQGPRLAAGAAVPTAALTEASRGERAGLRELWFLERADTEPMIRREPLTRADALVHLLQNSFAELGQPALWRELLVRNRRLVLNVPAFRACCPEGLDRLREAVALKAGGRNPSEPEA